MHKPSFWAAFEEASDELRFDSATKTQTLAREESDQRAVHISVSTKTKTAAREEDDQDASSHGCSALPRISGTETQTTTKTREETDQDPVRSGVAAVPRVGQMHA